MKKRTSAEDFFSGSFVNKVFVKITNYRIRQLFQVFRFTPKMLQRVSAPGHVLDGKICRIVHCVVTMFHLKK